MTSALFKTHSVELDTGPGVSWEVAREQAEVSLSDHVKFGMSLRITRDVPIRFVSRKHS